VPGELIYAVARMRRTSTQAETLASAENAEASQKMEAGDLKLTGHRA
jgi:hypothetical protein